jgi:hypothetical protein
VAVIVLQDYQKPIGDFIAEIKKLATLKRIHDQLHRIRQFGICRWRDEVLNLWEQGAIDGEAKEVFWEVLSDVREGIGALKVLRTDLPRDPSIPLDERLQTALAFELPTRERMANMARTDFERKLHDFARSVQKAFSTADQAMRRRMDTLRKQYTALIKGLSDARKSQALSAQQDQVLNEGLDQVAKALDETEEVLNRHCRWQNIHNALEDLDLCSQDDFRGELDDFLKSNRDEICKLLGEVGTVLECINTEVLTSKTNAIKELVCVKPDQLGDRATTAYTSMRKAYDDLFFDLDIAALAFVNQSDAQAKTYEERLQELERQVRSRTIPMR